MNAEEFLEPFLARLPFWEHLSSREQKLLASRSTFQSFEKNQVINSSDTSCMGIVFIREGGIRVCLLSDEGREIMLYRLASGDCCVTTASCVIQQITFDTLVYASEFTRLLVIPAPVCKQLADSNIYFRCFMFETETARFSQAIWVIQQLLFKRFDQRLATQLLSAYEQSGDPDLRLTQEELAKDVNSAREVVARMLRHFSEQGLVKVQRGHIILCDIQGLRDLL